MTRSYLKQLIITVVNRKFGPNIFMNFDKKEEIMKISNIGFKFMKNFHSKNIYYPQFLYLNLTRLQKFSKDIPSYNRG